MEIIDCQYEELEDAGHLFSRALEDDGWVLYHATTSVAEDKIDFGGLACTPDRDEHLIALIKVFRAMNWAGMTRQGIRF